MKSWLIKTIVYVLALVCLVGAGVWIFRPVVHEDQARVLRVVDGDTLKVTYLGRPERIRLIGIDAPESADNFKARRDARRSHRSLNAVLIQGQQAKHYVQTLIKPGILLRLEFDAERQDKYGRLLAYVYLPDRRMLNELIIRNGFAQTLTVPPNVKYQALFLESGRKAREERLGLWK